MNEQILLADHRDTSAPDRNDLSQYFSLSFYKDGLNQIADTTRGSINNFLKSLSEIEDEFVSVVQNQQPTIIGMQELEHSTKTSYMEENY